ncbi:hypothetical protein [Candidatus Ichthyocystis hellenicum]|uniref:hypothetical protein n=1 Tax=Candidatus Ichthyocystis hellenicum TaxID=1561003 RepID=UPI000B8164BA|nr:hypothetical protein [Candidatus Ichthyocystis hellenicum]
MPLACPEHTTFFVLCWQNNLRCMLRLRLIAVQCRLSFWWMCGALSGVGVFIITSLPLYICRKVVLSC